MGGGVNYYFNVRILCGVKTCAGVTDALPTPLASYTPLHRVRLLRRLRSHARRRDAGRGCAGRRRDRRHGGRHNDHRREGPRRARHKVVRQGLVRSLCGYLRRDECRDAHAGARTHAGRQEEPVARVELAGQVQHGAHRPTACGAWTGSLRPSLTRLWPARCGLRRARRPSIRSCTCASSTRTTSPATMRWASSSSRSPT